MNYKDIFEKALIESLEPETVRTLWPDLSEEDFNKLQALLTIRSSNYIFENFYAFENVVRALNNIIPRTDMIEGAEPSWIWYACDVLAKMRPKMELEQEVVEYVKKIYSDQGIYFLHPYITKNSSSDMSSYAQILIAAKHKADNGPFPVEADSFINRQAIEYMKIEVYIKEIK